MGTLGIAIVGAGLMGRWHAATARRLGAEVLGVVDADSARGARLAAQCRAPAFATTAEVSSLARLDVAHVCTPLGTHRQIVGTLLDAGCHVVCEKPLARNASEVEDLYALARRAGRQLCPVHQFALQRGTMQALAGLTEIGELRHIGFRFHSAGATGRDAGVLNDIARDILPHPLSVLGMLQPAQPLQAIDWELRAPARGELLAIGCHGTVTVSISISLSARPTEAAVSIHGTAATVVLDFFHGYAAWSRGRPSRGDKAWRPFGASLARLGAASHNLCRRVVTWEPAYPGLRSLLARFYASLDGSGPAPFEAAQVVDVYHACDAIAACMTEGAGR